MTFIPCEVEESIFFYLVECWSCKARWVEGHRNNYCPRCGAVQFGKYVAIEPSIFTGGESSMRLLIFDEKEL